MRRAALIVALVMLAFVRPALADPAADRAHERTRGWLILGAGVVATVAGFGAFIYESSQHSQGESHTLLIGGALLGTLGIIGDIAGPVIISQNQDPDPISAGDPLLSSRSRMPAFRGITIGGRF